MLLGGRVGLGIVIRPLLLSASSWACVFSLLLSLHRPPCSRTTCLLDIAWLGSLAGQSAVPVAEVHNFCMGGQSAVPVAEVHVSCMGTYRVTVAGLLALHGDTHADVMT